MTVHDSEDIGNDLLNLEDLVRSLPSGVVDGGFVVPREAILRRVRQLLDKYLEPECEPDSPFDDCRIADDIEDRHAARGER